MFRNTIIASLLLAVAAPTVAQLQAKAGPQALPAADFMVPIHTSQADPEGGAYGVWAMGPGYKASFHDGFTFYPFLGADAPRHLPLKWRTRSVTAGGQRLFEAGAAPRHQHGSYRYEYHYPGVVEAYDVRKDGVEQTFTIARRPARGGDIVVTGEISTELSAELLEATHGDLTFADNEGTKRVSFGAAFAVDAIGRKVEMKTSFDGRNIRLTLDGRWVAHATFPLTIDPLTSPVWIYGSPNPSWGPITKSDLETIYWKPGARTMVVVHSRKFTSTDVDCFAQVMNEDFSNRATIFSDITTSWTTDHPSVTIVHNANRWAIAMHRTFKSPARSGIRVYRHASNSYTLNSGKVLFLSLPTGQTHRFPDIGGNHAAGRPQGLVVYQVDKSTTNSNTNNSEVMGVLVDVKNDKFLTPFRLGTLIAGTIFDREYPSVSRYATAPSGDYWIVTWQELDRRYATDDWDIALGRIKNDGVGTRNGQVYMGTTSTSHKTRPKVDGYPPRFMLSYNRSSLFSTLVMVQRFDWTRTGSLPTHNGVRVVASGSVTSRVSLSGIAYDHITRSHWGVVYTRGGKELHVDRVGYRGGVVEQNVVKLSYSVLAPSIAFSQDNRGFVTVSGDTGFLYPLHGRVLTYPADAKNIPYGTGCGGAIAAGLPYAGNEYFGVSLSGAKPNVPAILILALGPGSFQFPANSGCFFNINFNTVVATFSVTTSLFGGASMNFPLPDDLTTKGNVYFQWMHQDQAANSFGWRLTQGLKAQVR